MFQLSDLELDDLRHFRDYPELERRIFSINQKVKNIHLEESMNDVTLEGAKIKFSPLKHDSMIVHVFGEINTYNSKNFQEAVQKAIDQGYRKFIFDCKNVTYLSSTGVGAFTFILKALNTVQGKIVICEMINRVLEVFSLLGFNKFFDIYDSVSDAMEIINPSSVKKELFPVMVTCPICDKKYKIVKTGKYRCTSCKTIFSVDEKGELYLA